MPIGSMPEGTAGQRGQASVEWLALVLLIALLLGALVGAGLRVPGASLASTIAQRMLCALGSGACGETPPLVAEYGAEIAAEVRRFAPGLAFERGESTMPVDFRECRERQCARHGGRGQLGGDPGGRRPVAFTRVVDCRAVATGSGAAVATGSGAAIASNAADPPLNPGCLDPAAAGNLYIQYWFYYPDSSTFEGVPVLEERGYHPHDWESYQVRVDENGSTTARASSHHGHNHRQGVINWASDAGLKAVNRVIERSGARPSGGWGEPSGWLFVTAGSHAGNVRGRPLRVSSYSEPEDLQLIPVETVADDVNQPDFAPITPPWRKRLWRDPESEVTS